MPTFKKKIVTPKVYNARSIFKGGREITPLTKDRIAKMADTANRMLKAGLKIPAPFAHNDENKIVPKPLANDKEGSWNAAINGGYWKKFEVDPVDGGLVGILEAPGTEEDLNTPAGKIGKTIQETSILVLPKWKDGEGRNWEEALWHVALVDGKSVESNQKNFERVEDQELALAMSFGMADAVDTSDANPADQGKNDIASIPKIRELLSSKLGIDLPDDTSESNVLDRMLTVLTAIKTKEEEGDMSSQPEGTEAPSSPIAMSDEISKEAFEIIEKKAQSLLNTLSGMHKKDLKERIQTLLKKGFIGKKLAEDWSTRTDAIAMSLNDVHEDVDITDTAIAMAVSALEEDGISRINPDNMNEAPEDSEEASSPKDLFGEDKPMSEKVETEMFANMGI